MPLNKEMLDKLYRRKVGQELALKKLQAENEPGAPRVHKPDAELELEDALSASKISAVQSNIDIIDSIIEDYIKFHG